MEAQPEKTVIDDVAYGIVATDVTVADYMEHYAEQHYEWENGAVYKMSPIHARHDEIVRYILRLLEAYLDHKPIGKIRLDPFVMRLPEIESRRQPNIQIILDSNPNRLTPTFMDGPADICIEVVSPGSVEHDRGKKFKEYEQGGVHEYWIIDPLHDECLLYRMNDTGSYVRQETDQDGNYQTPKLPGLKLHVPTLWENQLPGPIAVGQAVQAMLA